MRVNERQEQLVRSKPKDWLEIVTTGCHAGKWIEDTTSDSFRFIAKDSHGVWHGIWLIHSIHIAKDFKSAWACISDNVPRIEELAKEKQENKAREIRRKLKPLIELISTIGDANKQLELVAISDASLTAKQFELALGHYGLWDIVPMQTKGMMRNNLKHISKSKQWFAKGKGSQRLFKLLERLLEFRQESIDWANTPLVEQQAIDNLFVKQVHS